MAGFRERLRRGVNGLSIRDQGRQSEYQILLAADPFAVNVLRGWSAPVETGRIPVLETAVSKPGRSSP